ncbi:putative RING zinc finger domain superfamily protein isoform X1 [Zea mays]|uniref:putative RING zinc finger domain superfamily protein isoform X1 n=1 Tax=Zea mays TaxID=4577 RepID=UPI0009AA13F6|nr:putative RING zinc finger domain superfamily protein isoform X1 [Zea mays]|eukprot:XP_020396041.1 putative RING zinc finger domain superfamily protein isoform X1 [Zea mays]
MALFIPVWLFHAVAARCLFSLPAPSPESCQRVPFHSIVATPLLVAFELLLCVYLEGLNHNGHVEPFIIDLKLVFLPLLALEIITLVDNFRMCGALMPGHGETITEEAIWERLPYFWVAISMVFLLAATSLMLLKLCGDAVTLGWWDLFINFGISQCFAFLVCIRWSNPMVIGGPVLIIPIVVFQVLLCMRLEGTPSNARFIPIRAIFLPIILLQVAAVSFAVWRLFSRLLTKLKDGTISQAHISVSSKVDELFMMIQCGSRLLHWWSIDEDSKEEQAHLCYANNIGYSTFCSYPPEVVKEMPKEVLVKEVQRLQLALEEQTEMANHSQQQCDRLRNERILCRICFERDICIVMLPCRHHVLCEPCSNKCQSCPICRLTVEGRLFVYDAVMSSNPSCYAV